MSYNDYGSFKNSQNYTQSVSSISLAANVGYGFLNNQLRPFVVLGISYLDTNQNKSYYNNASAAMHFGTGLEYFPKIFKGVGFRLALEGDNVPQGNHSYDDYNNNTGSVNVRSYINYYGALAFKF